MVGGVKFGGIAMTGTNGGSDVRKNSINHIGHFKEAPRASISADQQFKKHLQRLVVPDDDFISVSVHPIK